MSNEEIEAGIEREFRRMMLEDPTRMFMYFLSQIGRTMESANADTLNLSQEMTIEGARYVVSCKSTLKKVKKLKTNNHE